MSVVQATGWERVVAVVTLLLIYSPAAFTQKLAPPSDTQQKIDWAIFLPPGEGRFQTSVYCSSCHTLQQIVSQRNDEAGWTQTVHTMVYSNNASIQDEDAAVIISYLTRSFGLSTPRMDLPIDVNKAPKETLMLLPALSDEDAQKIIDARTKEKIKDFAALENIVGKEKVSKYRDVLSFK